MTQERTNIPPARDPAKGPGQTLRQARLDLRLAPEDVAQMLKLAPRQILALEDDNFASLPGPTYVRGYLRGYALLLGLKPEPVVEAFNRLSVSTPKVDLTKLVPEPQIGSDHHLVRIVSVGVIVVILGLALAWWFGRTERPAVPPVALSSAPPSAEVPVLPVEPDTTTASDAKPGPTASPAPKPTLGDQNLAPGASGIPSSPAPVAPPHPVVVAPRPVTPAPIVPPAQQAVPQTVPTPVPAAPALATGPRVKLTLITTQDSWAEVRDAKQNRLLYETVLAGRTVVLEGTAPLNVFLGNVEGVGVEFNGKPYDTTPYRRGPIARFTLGESGAGTSAGNVPQ
jgi:cytoskeleton protein RodZ